ncbi:MAG TPA: winged helix-turn-helix domain-containing protein [Terriglobales bacterium]|nr:winged helix-turn-helix domain-containing protein [Terriglobales bacterium]
MNEKSNPVYEFGPFILDTPQHLLLREGHPVSIAPKTYDTLLFLLQNNGRMVSKQELMSTLWPASFVEESNLTQQISTLRKALGESAGEQKYIVTISGRGYRFATDVKQVVKAPAENENLIIATPRSDATEAPRSDDSTQLMESPAGATSSNRMGSGLRITLIVVVLVLTAGIIIYRANSHRATKAPATSRSLAILPFRNLQQNAPSDFLGFSLADAVITRLGYVSTLTVRPSSAVERYRDQSIDIGKVGAELRADTLLTGNFIREGDNLRITSQLISVKDQNILWKGAFDLKYDKLLTVQDRVAQEIVKELALTLTPMEVERLKANAPGNPIAYEYFLRGVDLYSRNDFAMAIRVLEKSAELDPNYALTWAHLGRTYQASASFQFGGQEQYKKAQSAYEKALAINPDQIEANIFMANLFTDTGRVEQAVPLLREAYATNPNHPELLWELGYAYRFGGLLEKSTAEAERARTLDPGVKINNSAMNAYLYMGQYDRFLDGLPNTNDVAFVAFYRGLGHYYKNEPEPARQNFNRAYELDANMLQAQTGKAISYAIIRDQTNGLKLLREAELKIQQRGVMDAEATYKIAQAYAILGDNDSALRMLRRTVENGFFPHSYMMSDPLLDSLHGRQGFAEIMQLAQRRQAAFKSKFF